MQIHINGNISPVCSHFGAPSRNTGVLGQSFSENIGRELQVILTFSVNSTTEMYWHLKVRTWFDFIKDGDIKGSPTPKIAFK